MTPAQKIQVKQSEIRQKIAAMLEEPEEKRSETFEADLLKHTSDLKATETELQAAIAVEPEPEETKTETRTDETPEGRELRELEARANVGGIFDAVFGGGATGGAEKELQEHLGLAANQVPLVLLEHRDDVPDDLEVRTAGVTPAPATGSIGAMQHSIIPDVFPQSASAFLRIPQPRVAVGEQVYTILSTSATPGTPTKGGTQAHSAAAFTPNVLSPARIQASLFYAREDAARLRGMGDALRMNLSDALADELDQVILTGTDGLLAGSNLDNNNASAADTYASYRKRFAYDGVDGRYASMASALRILVGAETYADMAGTYRSNEDSMNALGALMSETGGVRVSANVSAVANSKQNGIVRRGARQDAVAPIWEGVTLISDEVTQAKEGEIVVTAVMLYAFKVLRKAGFRKVQAQHA